MKVYGGLNDVWQGYGWVVADAEIKSLKYQFYDGLPEGTLIGSREYF